MASMIISGLIHLLQQPRCMLEMEEQRQKLLDFFTDALPKLADAKLRAEAEPDVRTWLVDLNAAAYDANDIVDDFRYATLQAEAEADGCQNQNGDRVRVGLFHFSCFKISRINRSGVLQGIQDRIEDLVVNKIEDLVKRMRDLNFQPSQEINIASAERPQHMIFSSLTEIVGREKEKEDIVKFMLKPYPFELQIIGPQGIGKTAFVQSVCNDARISNHFECVVWLEVEPEFNIGKVTKSIIDQVIRKDCCILEGEIDLLQVRLYQELTGKRCIIVFDDVWNGCEQMWQFAFSVYKVGREGNCLIFTSTHVLEHEPYKDWIRHYELVLKPLKPKEGWNLFCQKAFSDDANDTFREILEELGKEIMVRCGGSPLAELGKEIMVRCGGSPLAELVKEIMVRCGGSPLAVNMIGSLLRLKKGNEEWQGIINQLKKVDNLNDIGATTSVKTIIKVCYDNLCSQVKQCFAFCSLFPKGHYIDKDLLIKLWMADGLLLPSDGPGSTPPEEKGNIIFNELASRHFFEDVKHAPEDNSYGNKHGYHSRVTCKLLGLIQEQAVIAASEFALQMPYLLSTSSNSPIDIPLVLQTNLAVRILVSPGDPFINNVNCSAVPRANSLRGLHLHSALFQQDLLEMKYMRHLRYLDLSGSRIKTLPESTSSLYFLQTLNLSKCLLLYQLPENMQYVRSLRHLYIHKCPKLKKMPAHLSQLCNLQTLTTYIVGEENTSTGIDEIKGLHLSGLLELYNLHKVKTAAIAKQADLSLKTNLDRLTLCWGSEQLVMPKENNDLAILEALQPHNQLKVLKIQQYGGKEFSTWLVDPMTTGLVNLVELHLIGCSQCTTLPAVWKLLSLRVLYLKHMPSLTCISRTDKKDSSELFFPSLKRLLLVGLNMLEKWQEVVVVEEEEEEEEEEEAATAEAEAETEAAAAAAAEEEEEEEEEARGGATCSKLKTTFEEEELIATPYALAKEEKEEFEEARGGATCSKLKTTFEEVVFTALEELEITSCPNLKTMPHVPQLKHITASIENYRLLQCVTNLITQPESLVEEANIAKASDAHNEPFPALGAGVVGRENKKLRTMRMDSTNSVFMPVALPHSLLGLWGPLHKLQYLEIINCNTLVSWPPGFRYLKCLIRLSIRKCPNLTGMLPAQANKYWAPSDVLQKLEFYGCSSLKQVPYFTNLSVLELDECPEVESILVDTERKPVDILYLSCTSWTSLPSEFGNMRMKTLWVSECYRLTSLPDWLARKPDLETLIINECLLLKELPGGHEWLSSLRKIQISMCPDLDKFCEEGPYSCIISQIGKRIDNPPSANDKDKKDDDKNDEEDVAAAASVGASTTGAPNTPQAPISTMNGDMKGMVDIKPRIVEDASDKSKMWKVTEINEPAQCRSLRLMDSLRTSKISRLIYTNSGVALLALGSNAINLLWKWPCNDNNPSGKATAGVTPQLWQPKSVLMTNDVTDSNPEDSMPCFTLSKNDRYVVSASGGKISRFSMITFKVMDTFDKLHPPAATFLAIDQQSNSIIAIGMDDSTIQIYDVIIDEIIKSQLKGHSKRITGLAFSYVLNVLVSSGADSQICVWSTDGWEKQRSKFLPNPQSHSGSNMSDMQVQFDQDQINFLVVHASQIAIYETTKLECLRQWVPRENAAPPISHATFSCDSQLVYATFVDATVCIFSASNLKLRCRILPAAYLPPDVSPNVHPLVVAAHPQEPNQFAIGLTDGGIHVIEPLESEGKWWAAPPSEKGSSTSLPPNAAQTAGASSSEQPSEIEQIED